jgi:arsenate reductase
MATPSGPSVQLFGRRDSRITQKALRFFKERRIAVTMVDIAQRPPAPTELRRFRERLGARALADTEGTAWRDAGMGYLLMSDDELFERLLAQPVLLRLPLARCGNRFAAGDDEAAWKTLTLANTI